MKSIHRSCVVYTHMCASASVVDGDKLRSRKFSVGEVMVRNLVCTIHPECLMNCLLAIIGRGPYDDLRSIVPAFSTEGWPSRDCCRRGLTLFVVGLLFMSSRPRGYSYPRVTVQSTGAYGYYLLRFVVPVQKRPMPVPVLETVNV